MRVKGENRSEGVSKGRVRLKGELWRERGRLSRGSMREKRERQEQEAIL